MKSCTSLYEKLCDNLSFNRTCKNRREMSATARASRDNPG